MKLRLIYTVVPVCVVILQLLAVTGISAQEADTLGTGHVLIQRSDADTLLIVVDHDFSRYLAVTAEDSILALSAGTRHLTIARKGAYDSFATVDVIADSLTAVVVQAYPAPSQRWSMYSSYLRLAWGATLVVHTDSDASIFIDGKNVGTGQALLDLPEDVYDVVVEHPVLGRKREKVYVTDSRLVTADIFLRPSPGRMRAMAVIPGGAHFYRRQPVRGGIAMAAVAGALSSTLYFHHQAQSVHKDFDTVRRLYAHAESEREALQLGDRADALFDDYSSHRRRRDIGLGVAAGIYALQLIDGFRRPKSGFRDPVDGRYLLEPTISPDGPQINLIYKF